MGLICHSHWEASFSSQSGRGRAQTTAWISQRHTGHLAVSFKTLLAQQPQKCVWPQGTRQALAAW